MNLVAGSKCGNAENQVFLYLDEVVEKMRAYDDAVADGAGVPNPRAPRSIDPTGFVFHEGRCGSTLVSNSLMAWDPAKTKLFSEPQPALQALLACDKSRVNCNVRKAAKLFRDTVYAMGRTNDPLESRMFMKLLPTSVLAIDVVKMAFPDTPWLFVYRDPIHVLVSNMKDRVNDNAPGPYCTEGMKQEHMSEFMADIVSRAGVSASNLTTVEYCAAYLVSDLTDRA